MGKYTKFLCLNLAIILITLTLGAEETLQFKGDYFIYSDDFDYLYGGGNIRLKTPTFTITGDSLYLELGTFSGVIYGDVRMTPIPIPGEKKEDEKTGENVKKYDAVFFKGFPPRWLTLTYGEEITVTGEKDLESSFNSFLKKAPEELKKSSLYFEFKEFRIDKNKKIKASIVIPYMMGLPTVPLRHFTIKRGDWAEKTMLAFNSIDYSGLNGLSLAFLLRLRAKSFTGDYDIKLYERGLFKMDNPKRGILISGQNRLLLKNKKELLNFSALYNPGKHAFNFKLTHRMDFKLFSYSLSQLVSSRERQPAFLELTSEVTLNPLKIIIPRFQAAYDLKKSYSYRVSSPLNLWKKLGVNVSWQRKILQDTYRSDTSEFGASLNLTMPVFNLSSNYNFSRNLIESTVRKNFSVNVKLKTLLLLMDNISIDISSFYMFSSLPFGNQTMNRISPGVNITVRSAGASMPLGLKLVPGFTFNHLWDNQEDNYTDFSYLLSLQEEIGKFRASLDYALASRYRANNFWIEGNNRKNMVFNLELKDILKYSALLRFYFNNDLALENISFSGQWNLPYDLKFSSFLLYYSMEKKFQTVEVFIEKTFNKKIKIQGGYSLALKRFFVKFITM